MTARIAASMRLKTRTTRRQPPRTRGRERCPGCGATWMSEMGGETLSRRTLGRTGLGITEIALGGGGIGGLRTTDSDRVGAATVKRAVELGITHLDTAPAYQHSERRF